MSTTTITRVEAAGNWLSSSLAMVAFPALLGISSGLACVAVRLFFRILQWCFLQHMGSLPSAAASLSTGRRIATPIFGAILATLITWLAARFGEGRHFEEYVEAVRFRGGRIPVLPTAWRTLSSAFSIATGAAIGREGSMIQLATMVTSWIGARIQMRTFSLSQKVAFGAAAAVAAAYQAPIGGIFFASEIVLGEWRWENTIPLLCSSACGWLVSRTILGAGPLFPVAGTLHATISAFWILPLSLLIALVGPAYQKILRWAKMAKSLPFALLWSACVVGILSLFEPRVWGNGDVALASLFHGNMTLVGILALLAFRLIATTACVGTGTIGGVFTPTLFAGAAVGLASAQLLPCHQASLFGVCGMALLLAAVTHAPMMAGFMAAELSGQWHILPLLICSAMLASLVARRISPACLYGIASSAPSE